MEQAATATTHRNELVRLHDQEWLRRQKVAGRAVALVLRHFANLMHEKGTGLTLRDVEDQALAQLEIAGCKPTFLNYRGFPGAVCLSVNETLVHGIPTGYELQEGDVVTIDVGATFEGAIADAAFTCVYGGAKDEQTVRMLKACQSALNAAIETVEVGRHLGVIGNTISKAARQSGYGVITLYGGHGLDYDTPHASPFVANHAEVYDCIRIQPGLAIAIEPMFVMGSDTFTRTLDDNWTVITKGLGCHFEHSVTVDTEGRPHIITEHGMQVEDYV